MRHVPLALLALLIGCPASFEGDAAGECSDDADNDQDGLFDCADPDCAGAAGCAGDDDDVTADDDDSGGDDDTTGDDDDATGDDDDATLFDAPLDLIELSAPNWGRDLATAATSITVEGIARDDVVGVTWSVSAGGVQTASGAATGTATWAAADVPLQPGDNELVFVASTADASGAATLRVTSNPGVGIVSALQLSTTVAILGEATAVTAAVWLEPGLTPDADASGLVRVGPVDASGAALSAVWAALEESSTPGLWTGTFSADVSQPSAVELRAITTVGGVDGVTPTSAFEVRPPLTADEWTAAEAVALRAAEAWEAAGGVDDPEAARTALVGQLLTEPLVRSVAIQPDLTWAASWIVEPDLPFSFAGQPETARGGGVPRSAASRARLRPVSQGLGSLQGHTASAGVVSGRQRAVEERGGAIEYTDGTDAKLLRAFAFADDETAEVYAALTNLTCPVVQASTVDGTILAFPVTDQHIREQLRAPLQQTVSHGGLVFDSDRGETLPAIFTSMAVTEAVALAQAAAVWSRGAFYELVPPRPGLPSRHYLGVLPKFIDMATVGQPLPNSIVVQSICYSGSGNELAAAYLSAGAGSFVGYSDVVDSTYAASRTETFWLGVAAGMTSLDAFDVMNTPYEHDEEDGVEDPVGEPPSPAYPRFFGDPTAIGLGDPVNGDFEAGQNGWTFTGTSTGHYGVTSSVSAPGFVPGTGAVAWGKIQTDPGPVTTMAKWTQVFCPPPSSTVTGSFSWQVIAEPYLGWSVAQDDRLILRVDLDDASVDLIATVDWTAVTNVLGTQGSGIQSTGWQTAGFTFQTPPDGAPQPVGISFMTFGYDADQWWAIVDDVQWSTP